MIETDLRSMLASSVTSSDVYNICAGRVYIGGLPQTVTYPAIVMFLINETEDHLSGVREDHIQYSCYADYYSSAMDLADSIVSKFKGLQRLISTGSTQNVFRSLYDNRSYLYDDSVTKHVAICDQLIQYKR